MNSLIVGPTGSGTSIFALKNKIIPDLKNSEPMVIFNRYNEMYDLIKDDIPRYKKIYIFNIDSQLNYNIFEKYKNDEEMLKRIISMILNSIKELRHVTSNEGFLLLNIMNLLMFNNKEINIENLEDVINDEYKIKDLSLRLFASKDICVENIEKCEEIYNSLKNYNIKDMNHIISFIERLGRLEMFKNTHKKFDINNFLEKDSVIFIDIDNSLFNNRYYNITNKILFIDIINSCTCKLIPVNIYIDESQCILDDDLTIDYFKNPIRFINTTCIFNNFNQIEYLTRSFGIDIFLDNFSENYISCYSYSKNKYIEKYVSQTTFDKYKSSRGFILKDFLDKKNDYKYLDLK